MIDEIGWMIDVCSVDARVSNLTQETINAIRTLLIRIVRECTTIATRRLSCLLVPTDDTRPREREDNLQGGGSK